MDNSCKPIAVGFVTYQLDTGLFVAQVTNSEQYGLIMRTMQSGEVWTPLHW